MAGIGFSLKRLFQKKGFFSLCRAYGYAGIICAGPMILGVILLVGIGLAARLAGMEGQQRELLNCMITYGLLVSLTVTSWFNMVTTRYVSDMLYEERQEKILPSFYGSCAAMLVIGGTGYGIFLWFSGVTLLEKILCLWFAMTLIVVWMEMVYLTALKDFQAIVFAFAFSLMVGFFLALVFVIVGWVTVSSLLFCVIVAYGIMMVWYYKLLLNYFPRSQGSSFNFLRYFDRYRSLALTGGFVNIGLFAHLVIMYFGPLKVQVQGLFYGAPLHDVPALCAFFSILITTINFVTSVEVRFYPTYRNYYGLFNDNGSIRDIDQAEEEMLDTLEKELVFDGHKQLISTILFLVFGSIILGYTDLGLNDTAVGIYRFLCVGYGIYAIANSIMLILLYFEDYAGALAGSAVFAAISVVLTILQNLYGSVSFFGLGFLCGALAFYLIVWLRLEWYTRRLPYFLLSRKFLEPEHESGLFAKIADHLDEKDRKQAGKPRKKWEKKYRKAKRAAMILVLCFLALGFAGCAQGGQKQEKADAGAASAQSETAKAGSKEKQAAKTAVEKEKTKEGHLRDNDALYAGEDDTSVVTMYLTVRKGNKADNTDHTWSEINSHDVYYYEDNDLERYNCEALLQVGDELGADETVSNATVQIRGQTSSKKEQKNYKIRIKEGMGEWNGQRTLALNKHIGDPYRFRNKLAYDLMEEIPQMMSARTQFVRLYVKDETAGGSGKFEDYGLYTQVEQINKTYLKSHGLDNRGHLYKINFFEWLPYDELCLKTDDGYDEKAFEEYLEIKGDDDHTKLLETIEEVNDYAIPIQETVEKRFDMENLCYWMAFHILIGNNDVGNRNHYLYSPQNSEKWYFISWDNDAAFSRTYYRGRDVAQGQSWEQGLTLYTYVTLFNRILREEEYRQMLDDAVNDLRENYLTKEKISSMTKQYADVVRPYLYRAPDIEHAPLEDVEEYNKQVSKLADEIDENYKYYRTSLEKPWPFYVGLPEKTSDGKLSVQWDVSYDLDNEEIRYTFILAKDYDFKDVIYKEENLYLPEATFDKLSPGTYYIRVQATNESGYTQECFDYVSKDSGGKAYGAYEFVVKKDGSIALPEQEDL